LKLGEQCRRFETEREKVLPFYQNTVLTGKDVDNLPIDNKLIVDFASTRADAKKEEKLKLQKQKMELFEGAGAATGGYLFSFSFSIVSVYAIAFVLLQNGMHE